MSDNEIVVSSAGSGENGSVVPYHFKIEKINRANCKLCQLDCRDEVEKWYEEQPRKNFTQIRNRLLQEKKIDLSLPSIKNHLIRHYDIVQKNAILSEYADDLQKWVDTQSDKVVSLKARVATLEREMMMLAAESDELAGDDKRKNAEMIRKLSETILVHQDKLSILEEDLKPVALVFNQLQMIIQDEMRDITSQTTRRVLIKVIERLKESIGDMIIE